ncbi:TonB-dependent receptor [Geovibrio ferrireducens]|uniref:TonB-dependent receptor n=1 Tax=Geovibrio ferrireducens TaxID=46201 RepID=UPI002247DF78|nr:TonB-dependent receptor [Geovibrio ferrireducens]
MLSRKLFGTLLAAAVILPAHAHADDSIYKLDNVTVTARKGEESAKDVPFSLSVIDGNELTNRGVKNFEDMLKQTVGVETSTYGGVETRIVRMRGVGSLQQVSPDDTSVIINIDGVPNNAGTATLSTMDIERVEILKGPQGTLMGRNSQSGAINIISKKPTKEFEGYIRGEYGDDNTFLTEGAVSGSLTEKLSARLAARYSGYDNQVKYYQTDEPVSKPRDLAVRGTLLWEPSSKTEVTFIAGYEEVNNRPEFRVLMPYDDKQEVDIPKDSSDADKDTNRYTLEVKHRFSKALFTSVTGYADAESTAKQFLYDGVLFRKQRGVTGNGSRTVINENTAFDQEFRLSSKPQDKVFWVTGVNYFYSDRDLINTDAWSTFQPSYTFNAEMDVNFKTRSQAVFGEMTYPVTERIKLTGGLRYTWEKKEYEANWAANPSNPSTIRTANDSGEIDDNFMTGRAAISYELTKEVNIYGVYSRGHKTAGFNEWATGFITGTREDRYYSEAEVDSYELGFKYESADRRFGLNGAVFYNDNKDDHVLVYNYSINASDVENFDTESKGVELEGYAKLGRFLINAGVGYTDTKIKSIPEGSSSGSEKGNKVPDTPEWSGTLSVSYFHNLPSFLGMKEPVFFSKLTERYVGSRSGDPADNFQFDSYHKLDARVGIMNGGLELYVWGDNLLDERYDLYGWYYGVSAVDGSEVVIGMPSKGRTLGLGAAYYF